MNGYFEDKRVVVTGGAGFLGGFVTDGLRRRGCGEIPWHEIWRDYARCLARLNIEVENKNQGDPAKTKR